MQTFNILDYVSIGCSQVSLCSKQLASIKLLVDQEAWSDRKEDTLQYANEDDLPIKYASFLSYIDDLTHELISCNYERTFVSLWRGGETIGWHHHVNDGEFKDEQAHWLIYLGSDHWCVEAGGVLQVHNDLTHQLKSFDPTFGTAVVLNNTSEHYLHRVTKFTPVRERIVLQVGYRYNGV